MACRVGMSTNPQARIRHWKETEGYTKSKILAHHLTYEEALEREKREALRLRCQARPGGAYVSGRMWSVYHVWGGRQLNSLALLVETRGTSDNRHSQPVAGYRRYG